MSSDTLRSEREVELDEDGRATLKPDLSWWDDGVCTFVGNAKYKNLTGSRTVPGDELRVRRHLELLGEVRLEPERPPDLRHRGL